MVQIRCACVAADAREDARRGVECHLQTLVSRHGHRGEGDACGGIIPSISLLSINTAFIARVNLTIRQHVAAVGRRVMTLCKGEEGLHQQLALYHVYYNFCLPHASLRLPLPQPQPTNGSGSARQWRPCTPAMAAGLTDHVWTLREVLLFRVPPWPQPVGM